LAAFQQGRPLRTSLLFVGSGALLPILRARAREGVVFAPFQNQSQMPKVYAACDLFVLPGRESWGLAVNEAMASGIPVVVSNRVGCHPDLVVPNRTGWVFPVTEVPALAQLLQGVCADRETLRTCGRRAQERVAAYCYTSAAEGLYSALRSLRLLQPGVAAAAPSIGGERGSAT